MNNANLEIQSIDIGVAQRAAVPRDVADHLGLERDDLIKSLVE
ncbi:MAG TPA: hypothetical protein PK170_03710 [Anaerolineae bacterium]|nr:hypothetical protein [Anaerolineae bacterium]